MTSSMVSGASYGSQQGMNYMHHKDPYLSLQQHIFELEIENTSLLVEREALCVENKTTVLLYEKLIASGAFPRFPITKLNRPTSPSHPNYIRFYTSKAYNTWLISAEAQKSDNACGPEPYLERASDGTKLNAEDISRIQKTCRLACAELVQRALAPQTWSQISASGRILVHSIMEENHPEFVLDSDGYKLKLSFTKWYPGWKQNNLDKDGRWLRKESGDDIKEEEDGDGEGHATSVKHARSDSHVPASQRALKRSKVETSVSPAPQAINSAPPANTNVPATPTSMEGNESDSDDGLKELCFGDTDEEIQVEDLLSLATFATTRFITTSPASPTTDAATKTPAEPTIADTSSRGSPPTQNDEAEVKPINTPPPSPDAAATPVPIPTVNADTGSKMRVNYKKPSGKMLCAHRYLRSSNPAVSSKTTATFNTYYSRLPQETKTLITLLLYDSEHSKLVSEGKWDKNANYKTNLSLKDALNSDLL
ncbi:hypothetical protein CONPUDRAFT_156695 [Coniophora puteana RWD-64-598 SS2]|uniref:Uncharacterized protein n=1 Tax=Coniophora puteana (strain RWD-64-598) TaxID=741705 RepID=A0A5M3MHN4_CONPW|nr:uncharacterized protein CONPUDRAFT_156695 [Coniophora puteana RWD-64-598 SS2]EIW78738.1 hypothetical protein CONPUDRAFT_156695 [Coniophora puteana RWD-64-598 SS2]